MAQAISCSNSLLEHSLPYRWCPSGRWCCRCPPLVWWSLSTTVSSARCSSCTPSVWRSSTSRPTTDRVLESGYRFVNRPSVWPPWGSNPAWYMWVTSQGRFLTPPKVRSSWVLLGTPSVGFPEFFYRVSRCQDGSGETGERHPLMWSHHRFWGPYVVLSPAACLPDLQRPWSSPSAMPAHLGACAGDVAMLAVTVAKPGAAVQFRCQRSVFLKLVLRVPMLPPSPATHLGSSLLHSNHFSIVSFLHHHHISTFFLRRHQISTVFLPTISVPMVRRCFPGTRSSLLEQLRRLLDLRSPRVRQDPEREQRERKVLLLGPWQSPTHLSGRSLSPWLYPLKRRGVVLQAFMGGYPLHETYQSGWRTLPWTVCHLAPECGFSYDPFFLWRFRPLPGGGLRSAPLASVERNWNPREAARSQMCCRGAALALIIFHCF